jgi:three-Cys-motif partner protein
MRSESRSEAAEGLQHLKRVSRVKHIILQKYFPAWAKILGSYSSQLAYIDCFAGPGQYEMDQNLVEGSPVIAVREAIALVQRHHVQKLLLYLIDEDQRQVSQLEGCLRSMQPYPPNLAVEVTRGDAGSLVPQFLSRLADRAPAFLLIDPYGHPLPLPMIRDILQRPRTETLINVMWFQINRDLSNPKVESRLNDLFGNGDWQKQPFMTNHGSGRERGFLEYFRAQLGAKYVLSFRVRYDPEDSTGGHRTKFYLLHASNHLKAALLMKEVMWPLGDEEGTFDYSGTFQGVLISSTPKETELADILLRMFKGKELTFDEICERTLELPYVPKHYRSVLRSLEGREIKIIRVVSKKSGITGADRILFNP